VERAAGRIEDVPVGWLLVGQAAGSHEAEVGDPHDAVAIDERVRGLEVAMHQPGPMRGGEPAGRLDVGRDDLAPAARPGVAPCREVVPVDQLHHDACAIAEPDDLVNRDDVLMRQPRHRLRLSHEPPPRLLVIAGDQLDRDQAG
jgi:hypothetical protein